ncbi:glycoside hydrolase family 18 [Trichoderma cornu-damae]|uniref:chitinase n=1 Tax=Trichoderma cornu-damae TaxID=654480 RepID=A0A9P8TST1_9HYPO|nr:glycoside hydrolase family 18 [Trichoderma cornu-damae]
MRIIPLIVLWSSLALSIATPDAPHEANSALRPCPDNCYGTPETWSVYSSLGRLKICKQPVLLDFAIHTPLEDATATVKLRMCTLSDERPHSNASSYKLAEQSSPDLPTCFPVNESKASLDLLTSHETGSAAMDDLRRAMDFLQQHLTDYVHCETTFLIGHVRGAIIAVYSGIAIEKSKTLPNIIQPLKEHFDAINATASSEPPKSVHIQLCEEGRNGDHTLGVAINTAGNISAVQESIQKWSRAACIKNQQEHSTKLRDITVYEATEYAIQGSKVVGSSNASSVRHPARDQIANSCRIATVVSGDSCGSLAKKCGISGEDLAKYNPSKSLCSTLRPGQIVCCSKGSLPDITPKPDPDGSCATYTIKSGDYCSQIAASNGLETSQLEEFNDKTTWGWSGCQNLAVGTKICLSRGTSPLPAPLTNAVCGPLVPGTNKPSAGQKIEDLNPCPLNSCCNIWGQCGITWDFCTPAVGPKGNPGTAPPGENGCISNCGVLVTTDGSPPSSFIKVAYYESWNWDRPCLNYRAEDISDTDYTHAHWAFASVDDNFEVVVNDTYRQLDDFLQLPQQRILSFGGWDFSTSPATFDKLRQAMSPAHVDKFVDNIANYLDKTGFDGVDVDWEYPGAPDIRGIPPGLKSDGPNYLAFLQKLRARLPPLKTLSIAAPASYWYLKSFPIAEMAKWVDYIVYMTYDLHGNCSRGHANLTETMYALSMIMKAGVDANKIVVGLLSYGRSFGMMDRAACINSLDDPACTFKGPDSTATPGECTGTAGYISNAELQEIIALESDDTLIDYDPPSDTAMVFYGSDWVSFLSDDSKARRTLLYREANLKGIVDWAVDLQEYTDDSLDPDNDDEGLSDTDPLAPCDDEYGAMEELDAAAGHIPEHCVTLYTLTALNGLLQTSIRNYTDIMSDGYDDKFDIYAESVVAQASLTLHKWVNTNGTNYFTCVVAETAVCCNVCRRSQRRSTECDYCFSGDCYHLAHSGDFGPPTQIQNKKVYNESEPCPPDYSRRGFGPDNPYGQSVYWTFSNETGFYADMESDTGIAKNKTKIGDYNRGNPCAPSSKPGDACWASGMDFGVPVIDNYSASDVANPKDIIQKGLENVQVLGPQIEGIITTLKLDGWVDDAPALIDSLSLPILMIASATEKMALVKKIAEKIDEERQKAFILAFLSAIFLFIPIIGEIAGAIGELADVGAILSMIGAAGNAGLDIYTIVDDPKNAPLAIFDLVLSPLALGDISKVKMAAQIRRGMRAEDVAKLGKSVESRMDTIDKVIGKCVAR